jgi:hypothetical protein
VRPSVPRLRAAGGLDLLSTAAREPMTVNTACTRLQLSNERIVAALKQTIFRA